MHEKLENMSFGEAVLSLRKDREWTVKDFIERLEAKGVEHLSPAYITRIEQYGEIPKPELILRIADVFQVDQEELLKCARRIKVEKFDKALEDKYQKAIGLYRTQRKRQ